MLRTPNLVKRTDASAVGALPAIGKQLRHYADGNLGRRFAFHRQADAQAAPPQSA